MKHELTTDPNVISVQTAARRSVSSQTWKKGLLILTFMGPALAIYLTYVVYPIISTFYYSLFNWTGIGSTQTFVGLSNYVKLLSDFIFLQSLQNNLLLTLASILTQLPLGLILALLLFAPIRGIRLFRTVYFLPLLMSTVAIGILWTFIYDPSFGIVNQGLGLVGLEAWQAGWLGEKETAFWAVVGTVCWQFTPFYMILFRAAIVGIPEDIYEAASIDGANGWKKFWHITLPMLRPTIITSSILAIIGSLKYFDLIFVMTGGGPDSSTELMATYMYKQAFAQFNMGYASAISFSMFAIAFVITVVFLSVDNYRKKRSEG
ncbi:carbohydrate ABC transporter permease [Ammoniphilus sp. YIM 78166]|uniref:carbohydrate ABC transporter permease n=1 Tax=Ammoniphilus sp. YIM 78166 TaxID=1644106 RepID=UPI001F0DB62E|nr:sugar ABC transporter permease [Ammoniphilus sp. YIM 78166]